MCSSDLAAVLCPSFARADVVSNPGWGERVAHDLRHAVILALQRWSERRRARRLAVLGA